MRFALLMVLATACAHRVGPSSAEIGSSDLSIYRAVLDTIFGPPADTAVRQLVLLDSTDVIKNRENIVGLLATYFSPVPALDTTAVSDLVRRGRESHSLNHLSRLRVRIPIVLVSQQTLNSIPRQEGPRENPDNYWSNFYQRYPRSSGVIELSAIGYSADGSLAILMVDQHCGFLCGNGYIVALRRMRGTWRTVFIERTWVS